MVGKKIPIKSYSTLRNHKQYLRNFFSLCWTKTLICASACMLYIFVYFGIGIGSCYTILFQLLIRICVFFFRFWWKAIFSLSTILFFHEPMHVLKKHVIQMWHPCSIQSHQSFTECVSTCSNITHAISHRSRLSYSLFSFIFTLSHSIFHYGQICDGIWFSCELCDCSHQKKIFTIFRESDRVSERASKRKSIILVLYQSESLCFTPAMANCKWFYLIFHFSVK